MRWGRSTDDRHGRPTRCTPQPALTGAGLKGACPCPPGADGASCEHAVAVALAWLDQAGEPSDDEYGDDAGPTASSSSERGAAAPDLTAFLLNQPVEWLVEQLLAATASDPLLRARWGVLASDDHHGGGPDMAAFRRQLDRSLTVPDYLDWDETGGYVDAAYDAIASIEDLLEHGWAASAVELTEHALRLLEEAVEIVDQNGEMTGVLDTAQELHLRACRDAHPDPVALAERLTRWAIDGEWGVFADATEAYADLYGEIGLARCREIVHDAWSELPALAPGASGGHCTSRETVTRLRLAFADTPEERVEILARDLSTAGRYIMIAAVLTAAGRFDEALTWLTDAQAAFPDRRDATVEEAVADTLRSAGRHQEAAEAEWTAYQRRPGLAAFRRLSTQLGPLPAWPAWRTRALAVLEHPAAPASWPETPFAARYGNSDLVDVLLSDGDTDAAWAAAQRGGCDAPIWLRLATGRAAAHPADAIPILTRVIDTARAKVRNRKDYAAVAAQLAVLRTWHHRAGTDTQFAADLQRIRASHRGRPALAWRDRITITTFLASFDLAPPGYVSRYLRSSKSAMTRSVPPSARTYARKVERVTVSNSPRSIADTLELGQQLADVLIGVPSCGRLPGHLSHPSSVD